MVQDAFRRGIGHAVQWYNILQVHLDQQLEAAIVAADATVRHSKAAPPSTFPSLSSPSVHQPNAHGDAPLTPCHMLTSCPNPSDGNLPVTPVPSPPLNECSRILQQRCPTCFGLNTFGRPGKTYAMNLHYLKVLLIRCLQRCGHHSGHRWKL